VLGFVRRWTRSAAHVGAVLRIAPSGARWSIGRGRPIPCDAAVAAFPGGAIVAARMFVAGSRRARRAQTNLPPGPEQVSPTPHPRSRSRRSRRRRKDHRDESEDAIPEKDRGQAGRAATAPSGAGDVRPRRPTRRSPRCRRAGPGPTDGLEASRPMWDGSPHCSSVTSATQGGIVSARAGRRRGLLQPRPAGTRDRQPRCALVGSAALDAEALALLQRAQPLPAWPTASP